MADLRLTPATDERRCALCKERVTPVATEDGGAFIVDEKEQTFCFACAKVVQSLDEAD